MTIAQEAIIYKTELAKPVEIDGGIVTVVSNMRDLWSQANIASDRLRILICFAGESARGPFAIASKTHRVDRHWAAAITRGRGYVEDRGATLTDAVDGSDAFYTKVEIYRDGFRSINTTSLELPLDYRGMKPMSNGNLIVDGYILEWSSAHDLPVLNPISSVQEIL